MMPAAPLAEPLAVLLLAAALRLVNG
jgi:hypothetical protein